MSAGADGIVCVRYQKWGGIPHWAMDLERLGEDDHGVWLGGRPGLVIRKGDEPPVTLGHTFVLLVPRGRWWTLARNEPGHHVELYVDIATPAEWEGDTVRIVDLDLDVVRHADGRVETLDEDEFDEHRSALAYPDHVVAGARATAERLVAAIGDRTEPFGDASAPWLGRLRG